jgi:hypothetical protein
LSNALSLRNNTGKVNKMFKAFLVLLILCATAKVAYADVDYQLKSAVQAREDVKKAMKRQGDIDRAMTWSGIAGKIDYATDCARNDAEVEFSVEKYPEFKKILEKKGYTVTPVQYMRDRFTVSW